jgi:oligopeptide/dipeptide ABC transporter ATP-binding protein
MTIGESVAEALDALEGVRDGAAAARRIAGSLEEVGLDPALTSRYPHELSGGQCQRAAIARATVVRPRLLICDEAVSALDVSVQAQIVNLLRDLSDRHGMGLLFISHNLAVVRYLCQEIAVLYRGRLVERGPRDAVFAAPLHPYTRALLAAVPRPVPGVAPGAPPIRGGADPADLVPAAGCLYRARCPEADGLCAREAPALGEAGAGHLAACHHAGVASSGSRRARPG